MKFEQIHKDLLRDSVTLTSLWEEYCDSCCAAKQPPYIYSQFCKLYSDYVDQHRLLVSDNLKTGIIQHKKYDNPVFNKSYEELAEHYRTALLPARVLAPKDKATVEGSVGALTRRLVSKFRNRRFFRFQELNETIWQELEAFNEKPFQKKEGSRSSVYREEELSFMQPLPGFSHEFATWKIATVQLNYHISFDKQNYTEHADSAIKDFTAAWDNMSQTQIIYLKTISFTANGTAPDSNDGLSPSGLLQKKWSTGYLNHIG